MSSINKVLPSTSKSPTSSVDSAHLKFRIQAPTSLSENDFSPRLQIQSLRNDCCPPDTLNPNNVSLQAAYNRTIRIRNRLMRLDLLARKPDVTLQSLRWAIIGTGSDTTNLTRDITEFLEVLNQKQIQKMKRKKYMMKKKNKEQPAKE